MKLFVGLFFILCSCATITAQNIVGYTPLDTNKLIWKGKVKSNSRHKLWTGVDTSGRVIVKCNYQNGILSGNWIGYGINGKIKEMGTYANGVREGMWYRFYNNGDTLEATSYLNGVRHGVNKEYSNARYVWRSGNFRNGKRDGEWEMFDPSTIPAQRTIMVYVNDTIVGYMRTYTGDRLTQETEYIDGSPIGNSRRWNADGTPRYSEELVSETERIRIDYAQGGLVKDSGRTEYGVRTGLWRIGYDDGSLRRYEWYGSILKDTTALLNQSPYGSRTKFRYIADLDSSHNYSREGQRVQREIFRDTSGKIRLEGGVSDLYTYDVTTGKLLRKETMVRRMQSGLIYTYYPNGTVRSVTQKQSFLKHGPCVWYYENGKVWVRDTLDQDHQGPHAQIFSRTGKPVAKGSPLYNSQLDSLRRLEGLLSPRQVQIPQNQISYWGSDVPEVIAPVAIEEEVNENQIYTYCEVMPSFKEGGEAGFQKYLKSNLKYPTSPADSAISGTVYISFEVHKDGSIQNVKCVRAITGHPAFHEEAIRVIKAMPAWNPGRMNGKVVIVNMTMPVKFER